ncbi:acyl-CoA desaturase 1-like [Oppia nitens]|uniref:acyl-CoA desaturase 1-like n=1 Tax=Oppia nitens TaxID=1686743 RepID=UPI0023DA8815|nr:acyl-CoA desaturase 1-like [Oppia nitens]
MDNNVSHHKQQLQQQVVNMGDDTNGEEELYTQSDEKFEDNNNANQCPGADTNADKKGYTCRIFGYRWSQIKWSNVLFLSAMHILAIYGYYHCIVSPIKVLTVSFIYIISCASGIGILVGSHRLWAHKSFKARWPLRLALMIMQTVSVNGSIYSYVRDHRTHHKWSDSVADPKNSNRGFFFAHIGWWLLKKDPKVIECGRKLRYDDLWSDPIVRFQHRFYTPLVIVFCFILPAVIPLIWSEDLLTAFVSCVGIRAVVVLHHMWTVNSIAHIFGDRYYDKRLRPTENKLVVYMSMGEGSHNYHHAFPWDYTTSYYKWYESYNLATLVIVISSLVGLAYDLKKPNKETIRNYVEKKGDIIEIDRIHNRSLCVRLLLGLIDWIMGSIVTSWPIWTILIIKIALGFQWFFFDFNDLIFIKYFN